MTLRPCLELGCSNLTRTTRCTLHQRQHERTRLAPYQGEYRLHRAAVLAAEPWCHSTPCPYPDSGTPANPLTADHLVPVARGGSPDQLTVLCRRCNSAKADRETRSPSQAGLGE